MHLLAFIAIDEKRPYNSHDVQIHFGRFQLMFYKHLWDILVTFRFPSDQFYDHFSLNPDCELSEEIREVMAKSGCPAKVKILSS